ncbi:MAG TPA: hypothetical protein VLK26_11190 [Rudaea sp.]|nr:hypothetical protein [Rudaea sp.]
MSIIAGFIAAAFSISVSAKDAPCSIAPPANASNAQLAALAKVTKDAAQTSALKAINVAGKMAPQSTELKAENGCLIWSFDIRNAGTGATYAVIVDAGNGAVISVNGQSPAK